MIKQLHASRAASGTAKIRKNRVISYHTGGNFHFSPTAQASFSTQRTVCAPFSLRHEAVSREKTASLLSQHRHVSGDALISDGGLERTALHELHIRHGGKMVPFGGFSMPVQYSDLGVGESHKWTREKASLFDVGHM